MRIHVSLIAVAALAGAGCGEDGGLEPAATASGDGRASAKPARERPVVPVEVEARLPAGSRTVVDREDRIAVKLPPGWHRASERVTRRVSLVEGSVLAVGTAPIRPRADAACSGAPDEPRIDVGPRDALVVVEEDTRARAELARERPRFRLLEQVAPPSPSGSERTGVFPAWPCRSQVGVVGLRETSFADAGRVFSVTAIVGAAASDRTRSATLGVVRSLRPVAR